MVLEKEYFTAKEASEFLGVALQTVYHYTHEKRIPHYKPLGRKVYFLKSDLESFIQQSRISSMQELDAKAEAHLLKGGN